MTTAQTHSEMLAIGFDFEHWQDVVEAAIATNQLTVTGEIRGGQLIQFADASGAQLNILAFEPFSTYIGFDGITQAFAHVSMVNDVLSYMNIITPTGDTIAEITANLAQAHSWQRLKSNSGNRSVLPPWGFRCSRMIRPLLSKKKKACTQPYLNLKVLKSSTLEMAQQHQLPVPVSQRAFWNPAGVITSSVESASSMLYSMEHSHLIYAFLNASENFLPRTPFSREPL